MGDFKTCSECGSTEFNIIKIDSVEVLLECTECHRRYLRIFGDDSIYVMDSGCVEYYRVEGLWA